MVRIKRGDIYWLDFNPTIGTEIKKIRPALIIFSFAKRIITLSITSNKEVHEWQIVFEKLIKDKGGKILVDQIRAFDKKRLLRKIGEINKESMLKVNLMLKKMLLT
jgi:mRNA interferase MazF